jgi:hypothetical protein
VHCCIENESYFQNEGSKFTIEDLDQSLCTHIVYYKAVIGINNFYSEYPKLDYTDKKSQGNQKKWDKIHFVRYRV